VTKSDKQCHSYYGSLPTGKTRQIFDTVNKSPVPITPSEIAQETKINPGTVRKELTRLETKGFIRKECYGHYVSQLADVTLSQSMVGSDSDNRAQGLTASLPTLHSLWLTVKSVSVGAGRWELDLDVAKLTFLVHKNATAQIYVDAVDDYSWDYAGFRVLVEIFRRELRLESLENIMVTSQEWNNDFIGFRLDGVQALTLTAFDGSFRRLYNKKLGLRDEVRIHSQIELENVLAVMKGGVSASNLYQWLFLTIKELKASNELSEKRDRALADALSSMKRLTDALLRK
jgi:hypothetical protein